MDNQVVVILGASNKPDRYAYKALTMLKDYGHTVIPVNPALEIIDDIPVIHSIKEINTPVSTLTLYLRPERYMPFIEDIIKLKPTRIIFNPETESSEAFSQFSKAGIKCINGCTLVMLRTKQW